MKSQILLNEIRKKAMESRNSVIENYSLANLQMNKLSEKLISKTINNLENKQKETYITTIINNYSYNDKERKVAQIIFETNGCRMKRKGSCWFCNYGAYSDDRKLDYKKMISNFYNIISKIEANSIVLDALGSITDEEEFDPLALKEIIKMAIEKSKSKNIIIETHILKISENLISYIEKINAGRKNIIFEVGVEDFNLNNRKLLNKIGVNNEYLIKKYYDLKNHNITLSMNYIYGIPFMNEEDRIIEFYRSIKQASIKMPKSEFVTFLMGIKDNTVLKVLNKGGFYKKADPWGFVQALYLVMTDRNINNFITISWFGEKVEKSIKNSLGYYNNKSKRIIMKAFNGINVSYNREEQIKILSEVIDVGRKNPIGYGFKDYLKNLRNYNNSKNRYDEYNKFMKKINDKICSL